MSKDIIGKPALFLQRVFGKGRWLTGREANYGLAGFYFSRGHVVAGDDWVKTRMIEIATNLVRNDEDLTDEICASAALPEAEL
jgi:hypothetical protein